MLRSVVERCSVCVGRVPGVSSEVSSDVAGSGCVVPPSASAFAVSLGSACRMTTSSVAPLLSSSVRMVRRVISFLATIRPVTVTKRIGWLLKKKSFWPVHSQPSSARNESTRRVVKEQKPTLEAPWSVESMHIHGRHFHPGEVRWRCLEAERGIECWLHILVCCHRVIFIDVRSRQGEIVGDGGTCSEVDSRGRAGSRGDITRCLSRSLGVVLLNFAELFSLSCFIKSYIQ